METDGCGSDLMVCGACKRTFQLNNISGFIKHKKFDCEDPGIESDPKSKTLVCLTCRQKFHTPWSLLKHAQNVHFLQIYLEQVYNLGTQSVQLSENNATNPAYSPLHGLDQDPNLTATLPVGQSMQQWIQGIEQEIERVENNHPIRSQAQGTDEHIRGKIEPCLNSNMKGVSSGNEYPLNRQFIGKSVSPVMNKVTPSTSPRPQRGMKNIEAILSAGVTTSVADKTSDNIIPSSSTSVNPSTPSVMSVGKAVSTCSPSLSYNGKMTSASVPSGSSFGKIMPDLMQNLSVNALMGEVDLPSSSTSGMKMTTDSNAPLSFGKIVPDFTYPTTPGFPALRATPPAQTSSKIAASSKAITSFGKLMPNISMADITEDEQLWTDTIDADVDMNGPDTSQMMQSIGKAMPVGVTSPDLDNSVLPEVPVSPSVATQTCAAITKAPLRPKSTELIVKKPERMRSGSSSTDQERCCEKVDCCQMGQQSWCCNNQDCGITVMPGTHESLKRCCSAVIPKKRKRHMEIKHKYGALSRARRRDKGKTISLSSVQVDPPTTKSNTDTGTGWFPTSTNSLSAASKDSRSSYSKQNSVITLAGKPSSVPISSKGSSVFKAARLQAYPDGSQTLPQTSLNPASGSSHKPDIPQQPASLVSPSSVNVVIPSVPAVMVPTSSPGKPLDIEDIGLNVSQAIIKTLGLSTGKFETSVKAASKTPKTVVRTDDTVTVTATETPMTTSDPLQSAPSPISLTGSSMILTDHIMGLPEFDLQIAEVETSHTEESKTLTDASRNEPNDKEQAIAGKKRRYPTSRPYKCDQCDHAFNQRIHLRKHQSKHTGIKPYKCDQCDYATVERSHLRVHMRVHTGEKPFKCAYCDYATAQNSTLKIHLNRHHPMSRRAASKKVDHRLRDSDGSGADSGMQVLPPGNNSSGHGMMFLQVVDGSTGLHTSMSQEQILSEVG